MQILLVAVRHSLEKWVVAHEPKKNEVFQVTARNLCKFTSFQGFVFVHNTDNYLFKPQRGRKKHKLLSAVF